MYAKCNQAGVEHKTESYFLVISQNMFGNWSLFLYICKERT